MSDDMGPDMAKDACDLPSQVEQLLPPSDGGMGSLNPALKPFCSIATNTTTHSVGVRENGHRTLTTVEAEPGFHRNPVFSRCLSTYEISFKKASFKGLGVKFHALLWKDVDTSRDWKPVVFC